MPHNLSLSFANQNGSIDPKDKFAPFGPLPVLDNWLMFGDVGPRVKNKDTLVIRLVWSGLPESFAWYYRGYALTPPMDNGAFKVDFYVLSEESTRLLNERPLVLFAEDERGMLMPERVFRLKVDSFGLSGIRIKMVLVGPVYGFGSDYYADAAVAGALASSQGKRSLAPNPPFVPQLSAVELFWEDELTGL